MSPRTDDNDKSSDYKNICSPRKNVKSENTNFIQNDIMGSSDVNKYEKSVSGGLKSCDETTSEEQNSKRSMTQIMALLGKKKSTPSTLYHVMEPNKKEEEYSNSNNMKNRSNNIHNTKNKDYNIIDGEHRKKQVERLEFSNTEMVGSKMSPNYNQKLSIEDNDSKQYLNDSLRSSQEWCSVRVELSPLTPNISVENHNRTEKEETVTNKMESSTDSKLETSDACKPLFLSNDSSEVLSPFHQITDYSQNKLPLKTTLQGCNKTNTSPGRQDKRNNTLHKSSEHDKEDLFIVDEEYMADTNDYLAVNFDINFSPLSYVSDSDSVIDTAERHSTVGNPAYLSHSDSVVTSKDGDYAILENNSTNVCDVMNPNEIDMKEQFIDKKSDTCSNLTKDNFEDSDKNSNPTERRENTNMTPNGCSPEYTCTENTNINIDDKGVNKSNLSNSNDDQPKSHLGSVVTININHDSINIQEYSKLVESNSSIHHSVDLDMGQEEKKSAYIIEDVAENSINTTKLDDNTVISPKGKDLSKSICVNKTEPYNNEITYKQNIHKDISCHKNDLKSMSNCDILTKNNETTEKLIQDHSSTGNLSYIPNEVSITDSLSQNDLSLPSVGEQTNDSIEKESHRINCNFAKDLQTDKNCEMEEKDTLLDEHFPVKSLIDLNFSPDSFHLSDESIIQNTCAQKSIIKVSALCLSKKFSESNSFSENQLFQEKMNENMNNFNHSNANMNLMSENCQQICSKINFTSESASSSKTTDNFGTTQQQHLNEQESIYMLNDTFESDQNTSAQECSEKEYYITDNISQTTDKGNNLSQKSTLHTALTNSQCQPDNYNNESEVVSQIENKKQIKLSKDQRKQGKYEMLENENFVRGDNSPTSWKNLVDYSPDFSNNSIGVDYTADYMESSPKGDYFADCNPEKRDFSPERTHSMNRKNKMKLSVQGLSDHDFSDLQHPDDIFAKKTQMMTRPDHVGIGEISINCQIQKQRDLRCTASEKLESYTMRGSVTSGAVRRKDNQETEPMTEDESFYIDLNDDKPRLKRGQTSSIMFQFQSSPAQFVPNTPEFLKSLTTRGSSQHCK
ncbi:unnamed protein product [Mytilus coruscus]|uniref:Uncharacterized protein n=1 Tax=Mytilus coruscus TaxID=42192 RepID=A0A6J8AEM7_MYTCO|nr:unnamed protein product [Mytilus coruscus]